MNPSTTPSGLAVAEPEQATRPSAKAQPATNAPEVVEVQAPDGQWVPVCRLDRLIPGRGVAALLPDGGQVALFLDRRGRTYAIGNRDPFTGACVLSRGLLGSTGHTAPFVASPLLKQRFDLRTGRCLDDPDTSVPVYATRRRS